MWNTTSVWTSLTHEVLTPFIDILHVGFGWRGSPQAAKLAARRKAKLSRPVPTAAQKGAVFHDLSAAEELLDSLEACGGASLEFNIQDNSNFVVHWR